MIHYKKALLELKKNKIKIYSEKVSVEDSINRISAVNLNSPYNYPAANNTAFDGFAINSKEAKNLSKKKSLKFKIIKTLAAGDNPNIKKVPKFSTIEVMTGAIIKKPFDTIIPVEQAQFFPNKTNVEFIKIINSKTIEMKVWERGVGITYACGSGACAAVFAGIKKNLLSNHVEVKLLKGSLNISIVNDEAIMSGPAEISYHGKVEI